jgi:predicted nuclease of restriction endonuclease-like (RecB) superfamily
MNELLYQYYKIACRLLGIENQNSREFYIVESVKNNWSYKQSYLRSYLQFIIKNDVVTNEKICTIYQYISLIFN